MREQFWRSCRDLAYIDFVLMRVLCLPVHVDHLCVWNCARNDWGSAEKYVCYEKAKLSLDEVGPKGFVTAHEWKGWCLLTCILGCCMRRSAAEQLWPCHVSDRQNNCEGTSQLFCCTVQYSYWFVGAMGLWSMALCHRACTELRRTDH